MSAQELTSATNLRQFPSAMGHVHEHEDALSTCSCGHDHAPPSSSRGRFVASLAPALACAFCPACLSTYAKVLAAAGVGIVFTERQHTMLLAAAVALSVVSGSWVSVRARQAGPLAVALLGCALIVAGHILSDASWLEWTGVFTLVVGGFMERRWRRGATSKATAPQPLGAGATR